MTRLAFADITLADLEAPGAFAERHIGPDEAAVAAMLEVVGAGSLDELIDRTAPAAIRTERPLALPPAIGED